MQPYFLPYLGYFSLINYVDFFIIFDVVQFKRHGWIERNRILSSGKDGWNYIKVPLKRHSQKTLIKDIEIRDDENWRNKILGQLSYYKKKADYYDDVLSLIYRIFEFKTDTIVELNNFSLKLICDYLEIDTEISIFSNMNISIDPPNMPDEWALNISKAMNATEYVNPPGGKDFFSPIKYSRQNIQLKFLRSKLHPYSQKQEKFEQGLSIIDVMMFNSVDKIKEMLNEFDLL